MGILVGGNQDIDNRSQLCPLLRQCVLAAFLGHINNDLFDLLPD
jgi:hypothetical protein